MVGMKGVDSNSVGFARQGREVTANPIAGAISEFPTAPSTSAPTAMRFQVAPFQSVRARRISELCRVVEMKGADYRAGLDKKNPTPTRVK